MTPAIKTERRIKVWVQARKDRAALSLDWHDPVSGQRKSKSAGTADRSLAETFRANLEDALNLNLPTPSERQPITKGTGRQRPACLADVTERVREFKIRRRRCVYFLLRRNVVVYVGQTRNLVKRIAFHLGDKDFDRVAYITPDDVDSAEQFYIEAYSPKYNTKHVITD